MSSPGTDLGAVFDDHVGAKFELKDDNAWFATMTEDAYLNHVPVATGARGRDAVRQFYAEHFIPARPDDVDVTLVSRTVGELQVVDELLVSLTHSKVMEFMPPGIEPTGRRVELPHVVIVGFDDEGKIAYEHVYWDQASLLVQIGLLDASTLPVLGAQQARALVDKNPSRELIDRARAR